VAATNGYASVIELKGRLYASNPDEQQSTEDDTKFEGVIEAVSRAIDTLKNRRFYTTTSDETRYYTAENSSRCKILDDLLSLTTLKTDFNGDGTFETTWTATDYKVFPYNYGENRPGLEIETTPFGTQYFPSYGGAVQVVGKFGYCTTAPKAIKEACLLGSMRVWGRKDLLYGIAGNAELGTLTVIANLQKDGEFMTLLNSVSKRVV
jgi:hypothetical protein